MRAVRIIIQSSRFLGEKERAMLRGILGLPPETADEKGPLEKPPPPPVSIALSEFSPLDL